MLRVSRYDFVVVLNLLIEVIFLMNGGKSFHNEAPLNFTHKPVTAQCFHSSPL